LLRDLNEHKNLSLLGDNFLFIPVDLDKSDSLLFLLQPL
jgi:hypothetical protein